jgi:hydroxyacylglutathione hydrolase
MHDAYTRSNLFKSSSLHLHRAASEAVCVTGRVLRLDLVAASHPHAAHVDEVGVFREAGHESLHVVGIPGGLHLLHEGFGVRLIHSGEDDTARPEVNKILGRRWLTAKFGTKEGIIVTGRVVQLRGRYGDRRCEQSTGRVEFTAAHRALGPVLQPLEKSRGPAKGDWLIRISDPAEGLRSRVPSSTLSVVKLVQYYLDCLSQASYLIGDEGTGRAVVVDPRRDVGIYLADAQQFGMRIELVIETHFHADFLSGHLELAARTGAEICYGSAAVADFRIRQLVDGERITLGDVALDILETPGHTPESISIVVWEHVGDPTPYGVLTGDTLFIGDVGRPDLLASVGFTAAEMARQLYRSLHEKLLRLPDATRVFPAHGAGSACGRNLSTETSSTMVDQRLFNYALQPMTEDAFVALVTEGQPAAPDYFVYDAMLNRQNRPLLDEHVDVPSMTLGEVLDAQRSGSILLDTRPALDYVAGHLRGSVHAGLDTRFAEFAGSVIATDVDIVITGDPETTTEARVRLSRIGFDRVVGALPDLVRHLAERPELAARTSRLTAAQLAERRTSLPDLQIVDVRNPGETTHGVVAGALVLPLPTLRAHLADLDPQRPVALYCAGGVRCVIAASLLEQRGFPDVSYVMGGYDALARELVA